MKLHFQHLRNTKNVGDFACSPFDYFDWGDATVSDVREDNTPDYDVGIYGGGKIFGGLARYKGVRRKPGMYNVAWGIGTVQSFPISLRYLKARRKMDLIGSRDYTDKRFSYAPCPSCMSPLFDSPAPARHDVVFYGHAGKTQSMGLSVPADMPHNNNNCSSLAEAIAFISSGRTVVSNSYHGVYWGLLLGRKVVCLPFSNKFGGYRLKPHYATPNNWLAEIDKAVAQPEMLALMRSSTIEFKNRVDVAVADKRG